MLKAGLAGALIMAPLLISGPAAAETVLIQIASVKSEAQARRAWTRLQRQHPDLLGGLDLVLQSVDLGTRGTFHRIRAGPLPNKATAEDLCWQLRAVKIDCLVVVR